MLAIVGDGSTTGGSSVAVALLTRSGICMVTVASLRSQSQAIRRDSVSVAALATNLSAQPWRNRLTQPLYSDTGPSDEVYDCHTRMPGGRCVHG